MKRRITYKEVTLLLGILAMLVALTLWVKAPAKKSSSQTTTVPSLVSSSSVSSLIQHAAEVIF